MASPTPQLSGKILAYSCAFPQRVTNENGECLYGYRFSQALGGCQACRLMAREVDYNMEWWDPECWRGRGGPWSEAWFAHDPDNNPSQKSYDWHMLSDRRSKHNRWERAYDWRMLPDRRPVHDIWRHANMFTGNGTWLSYSHEDTYDLDKGFSIEVQTFVLRQSLTLADCYRDKKAPLTTHCFLIARDIRQRAIVQLVTVKFCSYTIWTSATPANIRPIHALPRQFKWFGYQGVLDEIVTAPKRGPGVIQVHRHFWPYIRRGSAVDKVAPPWIPRVLMTPCSDCTVA